MLLAARSPAARLTLQSCSSQRARVLVGRVMAAQQQVHTEVLRDDDGSDSGVRCVTDSERALSRVVCAAGGAF